MMAQIISVEIDFFSKMAEVRRTGRKNIILLLLGGCQIFRDKDKGLVFSLTALNYKLNPETFSK